MFLYLIKWLLLGALPKAENPSDKPRFIYFESELSNANFVGEVVIERYDSANVFFRPVEYKDTIIKAFTLDDESGYLHHRINDPLDTINRSGYWPPKGDTVLLVTDSTNSVSLFAEKRKKYYRFWSPLGGLTSPTACFRFSPPILPITVRKEEYRYLNGCLMPVERLNQYRHVATEYHGKAIMKDLIPMFVWEYGDSVYLPGLKKWPAKYLDNAVTIEGKLEAQNGIGIFTTWKILK